MELFIQKNMKLIRNILGYTQAELADKLGITRQYLIKIEGGEVEMQRALSITFMAIAIHKTKQFDKESMVYKLMSVYMKEFENLMMDII